MMTTDAQINAKYLSEINRLVLEKDRIKLTSLVKNIKLNPNAAHSRRSSPSTTGGHTPSLMIDSNWSSSWDEVTKSRLIESLIINIPVMPIIVCEKEYNYHQVIDGKKRLKTVVDFYSNRLTLTKLEVEPYLNECIYSTLPVKVREQLDRRSLSLVNCIPMNDDVTETEIERLIGAVKKRY